jgi:hypothetical protein
VNSETPIEELDEFVAPSPSDTVEGLVGAALRIVIPIIGGA